MAAGRPSAYSEEMLKNAKAYVENYEVTGDCVPSIAGMACELGVCENTIQAWSRDEEKKEFLSTLGDLKAKQHRVTLNKGLLGDFNAAITKLLLYNHGYTEKSSNEHTGPDGGPVQITAIEIVAPQIDSEEE